MAIHRIFCAVVVALGALTLGAGIVRADNSEADLLRQQEQQRQIQAETEQVVRRLNTMLKVMEIYGVTGNQQKQMMEEMSTTLSGLSKNQMAEVVKRLGEAARTADEKVSEESREKAYESHRVIMVKLHEMMGRFEAVKSLDQAADRFEKHARNQLEQHLQTGQLIRDLDAFNKPDLPPTQKLLISKRMRNSGLEAKRQSDMQNDLDREVSLLVKQVLDIKPKLTSEHQDRVARMEKILADSRLQENLTTAAQKLRALGYPNHRLEQFRVANDLQWKTATSMMEIARALRLPGDTLAAWKEARDKIDQAIAKQDEIKEETAKIEPKQEKEKEPKVAPKEDPKADPKDLKFPDLTQLPKVDPKAAAAEKQAALEKAAQDAVAAEKAAELGKKQAQIEFEAQDTVNLLKPIAKEAADKLQAAEKAMEKSKQGLLKNEPKKALEPQAKATENLKEARKKLDELIAAAEKNKNDPAAALKNAIEKLDNLIKEQTTTREQTKETEGDKQNLKLPELAGKQKELAKQTDHLKNTPLPDNDKKAEKALEKAETAMKQAAKNLDAKQSPEAVAKQDKAIDALKEARAELAEKVAEIEKRREDIANLEKAAEKLAELTKQENQVAKNADKNAQQPKADAAPMNKELANKQGELTPKANDIAKEVEKAAPKAAEKIGESTKNMQAAKENLAKNDAKPGAEEAKEAAKKLNDAQEALQEAINDLKGKEIADQAALQKQDPMGAAQQIAKAIEEAQKAAEAAKQAENPLDAKADLAKQQAEIAKAAEKKNLPEAAQEAAQAAEALKMGDIAKALENQKNALEKLQDAAAKPMPADPKMGDPMAAKQGEAKPGEAKEGDMPGEAKKGDPMAGEAKQGEPKAGEPKQGEPMAKGEAPMKGDPMAQAKGEPKQGEAPMKGDPMAQAKGEPKQGEPKAGEPKAGEPKAGEPKAGPAEAAKAKQGEPKAGDPMAAAKNAGEPKQGDPMAAQGEKGMGEPMAQAKGDKGMGMGEGKGETPAQLAQQQQKLMDATKALAQSQQATKAAQAAVAQAQAQAPQQVQPQLQKAQQDLQKAQQDLQQGKPGEAGEAQAKAAEQLGKALDTLNNALAQMGKAPVQPGEATEAAQGKPMQTAQGEKGMGEGEKGMGEGEKGMGMGEGEKGKGEGEKGMGEGEKGKGEGQGKGKEPGKAQEKNQAKGEGERLADGKVSNGKSQLNDVNGDGSFLHLPPRQRELIRQAISGQLPPEYAGLIQQYYINLARGRAASGTAPSAGPAPTTPMTPR